MIQLDKKKKKTNKHRNVLVWGFGRYVDLHKNIEIIIAVIYYERDLADVGSNEVYDA